MAHQWTKTTHNYDLDGTSTDNSPEPVPTPRYVFTSDKLEIEESYNLDGPDHSYAWKREVRHMDGNGDLIYSSSDSVRITQTPTSEFLEERSNEGNWVQRWYREVPASGPHISVFSLTTIFNPGALSFPGTKEFWETQYLDDEPIGDPVFVGTFDVRAFRATNFRSEEFFFDPLEGGTLIRADFVALPAPGDSVLFPNGWTPTGSVSWEYEMERDPLVLPGESGTSSQIPIENSGKFAALQRPWNGKATDGKIVEAPVELELRAIVDVPGTGNARTTSQGLSRPYRRRCPDLQDNLKGECVLHFELMPGEELQPVVDYFSALSGRGTSSLGYGWRSTASARMVETSPGGSLIYKSENGMVMRWEPDGNGGYTPATDDNYVVAEKLSGGYRLTFKSQTVREFGSDGRLSADTDRNGNTVTYTHVGGQLDTVSDGKGRSLHYSYGSRSDGQPVSIRANNATTGRQVQLAYYAGSHPVSPNRLFQITDAEGDVTEFAYDEAGRMNKMTVVRPTLGDQMVEYQYSSFGRLYRETVNEEVEKTYSYSQNYVGDDLYDETYIEIHDLTSTEEDPEPLRQTLYRFDSQGNLVRIEEGAAEILIS